MLGPSLQTGRQGRVGQREVADRDGPLSQDLLDRSNQAFGFLSVVRRAQMPDQIDPLTEIGSGEILDGLNERPPNGIGTGWTESRLFGN
jgi:hypothetical protein